MNLRSSAKKLRMSDEFEAKSCPKPATSVHLRYKLPEFHLAEVKEVSFRNKVKVSKTANYTYFCAIQFWPGGYCGIQQRDSEDDKIAIFSLWNEDNNNVKLIDNGDNVTVQEFGGEGTGLKSTRPLDWNVGEEVGFVVTTTPNSDDKDVYRVRCDVEFRGSTIYIATYERKGAHPMQSFVCFVEDYCRDDNACGMTFQRSCSFVDTRCVIEGTTHDLTEATFTKVEDGDDAHGNDRCTGGVDAIGCFFLQTGNKRRMKQICCTGAVCKK